MQENDKNKKVTQLILTVVQSSVKFKIRVKTWLSIHLSNKLSFKAGYML